MKMMALYENGGAILPRRKNYQNKNRLYRHSQPKTFQYLKDFFIMGLFLIASSIILILVE